MKRLSFLLAILIFVSEAAAVDFKIFGGASLSRSTEPLEGYWLEIYLVSQYGAGFVVGGGIEFTLTRNIAFEADVLFFQKGSGIEMRQRGDPVPDEVIGHSMERMNELSFPVLYRFYLKPGNSPYLLGGGEFAFVLSKAPDPNNYGLISQRTEYGLVFGAGLRKQIKGGYLSVEGRYNHGLQDMASDFSILRKMRVFSVLVGLSF